MDLATKVQPWRCNQYLQWVRERSCVHCGQPNESEAHHLIGLTGGYMGGKAGDNLVVPLCDECHRGLHDGRLELSDQVGWLVRTQAAAFHDGVLIYEHDRAT